MQVGEDLQRLVVMVPRQVLEQIDAQALREGLNRSSLVRRVVMRYLQEQDQGQS